MRVRSSALAALLALAPFVLGGCEDEETRKAQARQQELKGRLSAGLASLEQSSADPQASYAQVLKDSARIRAIAIELGDAEAQKKTEELAQRAKDSQEKSLKQAFDKLADKGKDALGQSDPAAAAKACQEAQDSIDRAPAPVAARYGKELSDLRVQLASRGEAAKRAKEVLSTARQLKEEAKNVEARAVCRSFEVVGSLRDSPFKPLVTALMSEIPEKSETEEFLTIFDGTDEQQVKYFTREYEFQGAAFLFEKNLLHGTNTEYPEGPASTAWLGDDAGGWSDYVVEIRFKVDAVGLDFLVRAAKDEQDHPTTFDKIELTAADSGQGSWAQARLTVKGGKATCTVNGGAAKTLDLKEPKGILGFSLPGNADVSIQSVRLRLLDKDAKPPKLKVVEEAPKKEDDPGKKGKKGKGKGKKKEEAAKPDEEKKDPAKKDDGEKKDD